MSRRELTERVGIDPRYLANELPAERYFNPDLLQENS